MFSQNLDLDGFTRYPFADLGRKPRSSQFTTFAVKHIFEILRRPNFEVHMKNSDINININVSFLIPLDVAVHLCHMSHRWEVHQQFGFENVAEYAALKQLAASFFQNEAVVERIMTETYWSSADAAYAEASVWARKVSEQRLREGLHESLGSELGPSVR